MPGGDLVAAVLRAQGVRFLFTLCGGHISPILVSCKALGIRVIDVRHEATAVFAADAVARLTGVPGVAAVTAGPGATNTITAVKNAQLAQSPVVILGGATATALKGRGSLQDIDQIVLYKPHVKLAKSVRRVKELVPALEQAFLVAKSGVPGPVFIECPIDLLYEESVVRQWYNLKSDGGGTLQERLLRVYLRRHVNRIFAGANSVQPSGAMEVAPVPPTESLMRQVEAQLQRAEKPVLLIGSQAMIQASKASVLADSVSKLGIPAFLSGMARGLLGKNHPLQLRHRRRQAVSEADLVILAGVPCDFRLDYGRHISGKAFLVSVNRSRSDLRKNRRPSLGILADPGVYLTELSERVPQVKPRNQWLENLRQRDQERSREIERQSSEASDLVNPLKLCLVLETVLGENSVLVADGGDFVATSSYIVRPRAPLSWLDPGVFGTLGVGAGFALGAKLCRPEAEVWILYGDGSVGYSLAEFDTFVRHDLPVIALVGNDASWAQIAREQVEILRDDVGTKLRYTDYHLAAEGLGGKGFLLREGMAIREVLKEARSTAIEGRPALVNAHIAKTDFRKGSISM